jgi:uncharacterized protein (DUF1800 family)
MARIFTGWASAQANTSGEAAWTHDPDYLNPMACYASHHDADAKVILENVPIPAGGTCDSDLKVALDTLFNHPNTGPFIAKQLIQRLVTSNPSPAYVGRVSAVFANDGAGVRGNLLAVSKAILTDSEAINVSASADSGRLSEPMLRLTALWRAFSATAKNGLVADQVIGNASSDFGENAVSSPTVFNFFTPSFRQSGAIADAGLVSPEFQIVNENTIVLTANALLEQSYKFVGSTGKAEIGVDSVVGDGPPNDGDMVLHTAAWEADAADAANLVDQLGLVLMPGRLSDPMRSTLVAYVNDIPATSPANRVVETVALMINSPQYAVQR